MDFRVAQRELGRTHVDGAPGVFLSGVVWLALFTGGVLIEPGTRLLCGDLFRAPRPSANNPLSRLSLATASPLLAGLMVAYAALFEAPSQALPMFAVVIGARYAAFGSLHGEPLDWVLGAGIALAGVVSLGWIRAVAVGAMEVAADDGSGG
jgi:hypothetical protein